MDQKKYDELDKLFQSRLKNDKLVQENWNTPPKSVFDGAIAEMDKKNKKRRFIFWIVTAIILSGFIGFTINNLNRINQLENTIADLQTTEILKSVSNNNIEKEENKTAQFDAKQHIVPVEEIKTNQTGNNNINTTNFKYIPTVQNKPGKKISQNEVFSNMSANSPEEDIIESYNVVIDSRQLYEVGSLSKLRNGISSMAEPISGPVAILPIDKNSESKKSSLLTYAMSGINGTTIRMTNTEDASFSLTEYERYYADFYTGVGLEYQFNPRWSFDINASYNRMHVKSIFEDNIVYDKSNEMTDNQGMSYYEDDYDIYSVMGRLSGKLNFGLDQSTMSDQDNMSNKTTIDNSFRTFGLSLGPLYTPYQNNKFSISIGAGLSYHHLIKIREEMESTITHESGLSVRQMISTDAMEKANQNYWSIYGKVRFNYAINSDFGLKLDLSSAHSVNSIRKTDLDTEPKTYINNLRSGILFYYKF